MWAVSGLLGHSGQVTEGWLRCTPFSISPGGHPVFVLVTEVDLWHSLGDWGLLSNAGGWWWWMSGSSGWGVVASVM